MEEIKKLKGILTDLDETLYSYNPANKAGYKALFSHIEQTENKKTIEIEHALEEAKNIVKRNCEHQGASHSRLLYIQYMVEKLLGKTDTKKIIERNKIYDTAYLEAMTPFPGMIDFLTQAKKNGLKICIITDLTAEIQFKKIIRLGLEDIIDFIVTSEEAGAEKPATKNFEMGLKKCGLEKSEVCMLGDSTTTDIPGAQAAGIKKIFHKVIEKKGETPGAIQYETYQELKKIFNF
ncbi:MAG TPA: HAD family hydrolase [Candidatus Absconditabacterales bacterium]|nr:HAD family hydrolase [Candidatus Absconditabacterales bacterium]HMT27093.1 HAD family hydrolase [Candidatus Absconditabacterales bacterium]